jgi:hypothetical protein
VNERDR